MELAAPHIERILVPVDFSVDASAAVGYAELLARSLQASLTLLHVCQLPHGMAGIVPNAMPDDDIDAEHRAALRLLDPIAAELRTRVPTQIEVVVELAESPIEQIIEHARRGRIDLIVMGTHGRTGLSHLVAGSVAESVLRRAPCPVLAVRVPASARG